MFLAVTLWDTCPTTKLDFFEKKKKDKNWKKKKPLRDFYTIINKILTFL